MKPAKQKTIIDMFPYGAPELQEAMRRYLIEALLVAVGAHLFLISLYYVFLLFNPEEPPERVIRIVKYTDIGAPPSISDRPSPPPPPIPQTRNFTEEEGAGGNSYIAEAPPSSRPSKSTGDDGLYALRNPMAAASLNETAYDLLSQSYSFSGNGRGRDLIKGGALTPLEAASAGTFSEAKSLPLHEGVFSGSSQPLGGAPGNQYRPTQLPITPGKNGNAVKPAAGITRQSPSSVAPAVRPPAFVTQPQPAVNKTEDRPVQKIGVKKFDDADIKKVLKELFVKLVDWMKQEPRELSPAVKQFMSYKTGDLTTMVLIQTPDRLYELFIRSNELTEEVGILLASSGENGEAIYLRDVGFKQQSHYLGLGTVGRNEEGQVFTVSMREETPTKEHTSKFYNIFLSWWKANNS
jgi:hypothetical protein